MRDEGTAHGVHGAGTTAVEAMDAWFQRFMASDLRIRSKYPCRGLCICTPMSRPQYRSSDLILAFKSTMHTPTHENISDFRSQNLSL